VQGEKQTWGFISKEGRIVISPQFVRVGNFQQFSEGLAAVMVDWPAPDSAPQWGYIDPTGKMVIAPQFITAGPFSEGLAAVEIATWTADPDSSAPAVHAKRWGYIDKAGQMVIPPWFERAGAFCNGLAKVDEAGSHGYIDRQGKYVWRALTPDYRKVKR
jgi:hypothetical protein